MSRIRNLWNGTERTETYEVRASEHREVHHDVKVLHEAQAEALLYSGVAPVAAKLRSDDLDSSQLDGVAVDVESRALHLRARREQRGGHWDLAIGDYVTQRQMFGGASQITARGIRTEMSAVIERTYSARVPDQHLDA